ncbi:MULTISPECIES: hypothetical protein [Pseudomonas syringae group]|uniref:Uncharacterized protein n=1 Tax=Pseudomonas cannabina TaxID=86840 RepID=A0A3M3KEH8_PSECA|nr:MULTISPECIES: hypothetical protein [Pseudomonas syringae group]MDH4602417.1 hypothetical protein [Pseudomonas syringae pv. papulans]RMN21093.1 hypothetical protein ALQ64_02810 [Pseudomonas cannabina]
MTQDIAGSQRHPPSNFAKTPIDEMGLPPHLLNELQVQLDKIHTDATHEMLVHDLIYAKGLLRGLEVGKVLPTSQCLNLLELIENAYVNRDAQLRHGTV